ncbi:hypothetical protein COX84_05150 [Candidatus Micrarchaeota archaeon CG_4_10_14_0_2_um_filter_49_7]|nr:MAG: hypothetical protein COS70_04605 [Candidatus Micrarchaeota archaeon CG06_land_8_20_14_3_00_50_6]PIZ94605.1 MAG: hypothetical protein COX84_05150 [Candidatus Micrarchaeota archaeon CG_4_10_14_0_2_um_filter_49_7]HII53722.1 MoaD/ThiS family protein [Candidatus Micrarchaeota archaeon]
MKISYNGRQLNLKVKGKITAGKALQKLNIPKESVIVVMGKKVIPDNELLNDKDKIELLRTFSGG